MDTKQRSAEDKDVRIEIIRTVLNLYPFSIGIFREILQNSEDAKASKQIFLLDCRVHLPAKIRGTALEHTNGPALIAFNNATFRPEDWEGIFTVFRSSKRRDASKIGKYGMGFRACFHVTNYPQVFSEDTMVMLDPQGDFFDEGGVKLMLEDIPTEIRESLNLAWFREVQGQDALPGTIIRLPLRTEHHRRKISSKTVSPQEVEDHFQAFVQKEMDICLLFLSSLQSVEFWVIREGDTTPSRIALSSITPVVDASPNNIVLSRQVETTLYSSPSHGKDWLIRWHSVPNSESQDQLSTRIGCDVRSTMEVEKLVATVALAIQTSVSPDGCCAPGRLFTYLPLPSDTNYPCNVHAPFALTIDRQTLRNENEEGLLDGSDDHIRVEWNRYLFDTVVPVAWAKLLLDLSKLNLSLFSAWPSTQHVPGGCSYWQHVPEKALGWIMDNNIPVWPVQGASMLPTYHRYDDVLVAPPDITTTLLDAFASIGLAVAQPPKGVYNLAHMIHCHRLLTPELAHATISKLGTSIALDRNKRHVVLDYLLSTGKVENIIGIPLVEQVDGSVVALSRKTNTSPNHVLLDEQDQVVFCRFDPCAISITRTNLPSTVVQLLKSTTLLDVEPLEADHIINYITHALRYFGPFPGASSGASTEYISWVSEFFEWLQVSPLENILRSRLHEYCLLPVNSGQLKPISSGVFSTNHTHINGGLVQLLQRLGLSFLHPGISALALKYLDPYLKSLNNPHYVLTSLPPLPQSLSGPEIDSLQDYILSHKWTIQKDQAVLAVLRALPIYNHMVPSNLPLPQASGSTTNYLAEWSTIPDGVVIQVVAPDVTLLPIVPNTFFTSQLSLVQVLDQTLGTTSNLDVLQLVIHHFQSQPPELQTKFLEQLSTMHIPSTSLSHLQSIPFILGADGQFHAPKTLVDPTNRLANLLPPDSPHLPQYKTTLQQQMVDNLRSLSLLPNTLTVGIFQEIVGIVTNKQDSQLSDLLLDFLDDDTIPWSIPNLLLDCPWLNTTHGLSSPANSHDYCFAELCNHVLPLLKRAKRIQSQKLLHALHWNKPPTLQVVVAQFKALVSEGNPSCPELFPVTSFLGSHLEELSGGSHLQELQQFVKGRSWVPTTGSTLTSATFAIFKQDFVIHPFKQITSLFADNRDARSFLQAMGCMEKPSADAISLILQDLRNLPAYEVIAFLRAVSPEELKTVLETTGTYLPIVPTTDGVLKACSATYFNDLGPHVDEVPLPPGHSIASGDVDRNLALRLGLPFLSDRVSILDGDSPMEMKEDLNTRISSVLLSYTKEQAFMEFLANAADAGATEFGVTLDTNQHPLSGDHQFVSDSLKNLCGQPSLILHNNGVFSPSDWKGMCSVGSGSKKESVDGKLKIGRFGLGALSMFYFTEVSMILSGGYVLFLDPRKAYIGRGRSSYGVSLETMKKYFPAHLSLLHGHYGYDCSMDEYNGTLFNLHLRTEQQASQSTIYGKRFSGEEIKRLITDFRRRAQHALFFIPVRRIKASYPGLHRKYHDSWVVEKSTEALPGIVGIQYNHSSLQPKLERWSVLFKVIPYQDIPPYFHECLSIHKIQTISIGIAGALDTPPLHHRPFFGIPLLDTISLPIHLHCTFILSDDRRSIRYDEKGEGNLESKFNKWLLTEKVPSLYLQFLAGWNHNCPMKECPWWPSRTKADILSQVVVKAMETTLPTSDELVCDTYSGHRIAPSKAHFLQQLCPRGLLLKLLPEDLAIIPPVFSLLSPPPLQNVDSNYLTTILQNEAGSITSMYKEGRITVEDVVDVVRFLKPSLPNSTGLPLLPLADGTLASLSAEHTTFYCPPRQHKTPWFPFPPHHFLNPMATKEHDIYDSLHIQKLDNTAISRLIMDKIPKQDTFSSSPALEMWFKELWELLTTTPHIEIEDSAFQQLPLIPTYNPEAPTRISFQKLTESEVLFIEQADVPFDACVALGMKVIKARNCKKELKEVIRSRKEQPLGIRHAIVTFFMGFSLSHIPDCFQRLDRNLHSEFSRWFREQLSGSYYHSLRYTERAIVQHLPLWEAVQIGRTPAKLVSASTAVVIPEDVSPDVIQMWTTGSTPYVPADYLLSVMKKPVTLATLYTNHLSFPPVMSTVTPTYRSLLRKVLYSQNPQPSILVPNANGRMLSSSELYLSSDATFTSAFASQSRAFLHRELRDLEQQLCSWGLISTFTAPSFRACALAIHQDVGRAGILPRALTVFRTYNTEMPPKLLGDRGSQGRDALRNLRFIPRRMGTTRYGSIPTDRYHSLPNIVSPSEILDPKFVGVAWTQRATCLEEPSSELRLINNSTWEPTVSEVIKHLHVLSTEIAPSLRCNSELIEDLKATYSWLDDHKDEAEGLLDYNQDKLFLNVDSPVSEWRWDSASDLLFDEKDSTNPRRVRRFLKSYGGLLRAAGVREINHVSTDDLPSKVSHETQLEQIRTSFNQMREAGQLTDVTFIAEDGTEFAAHRVFLAAQSRHFKSCFALGWRESRDLEGNVEINVDHSQGCLEALLDWMYKGSYDLPAEETERLDVLQEMYKLAHYWDFVDSDLFNGLTRELIESIGTQTYGDLRKLAEYLKLEDGPLAKKCEEFERKNRTVLAESR